MKATCFSKVLLRDLGRIVTGKTPSSKKPELFGDAYPFITPSEMGFGERIAKPVRFLSDEGARAQASLMLPPGTVAFVCIASIGKACVVKEASFTNQQVNSIIVDAEHYDPEYVYYLLVFSRGRIQSYAGGAATPIINKSDFGAIEVSVPPLPVQRRIVSALSVYDDLIENNARRIEILEEMARRLYDKWFVQFRFPGHEGVEFRESELGLIPERWKVSTLDEFGEIITGKTPSKQNSEFFGCDVPFIKLPDMHGNTFIVETSEYLSQEGANSQRAKTIPPGSICVSCIGTAGVVVIASEFSQTNQQINSIVPRAPGMREFLFFLAKSLKGKINDYGATGATMTNLSRGKFASLQVIEPDEGVLSNYSKITSPLFDKILCLQKTNCNLRAQRDLLLPKLISGEIDVSDIPMPT